MRQTIVQYYSTKTVAAMQASVQGDPDPQGDPAFEDVSWTQLRAVLM